MNYHRALTLVLLVGALVIPLRAQSGQSEQAMTSDDSPPDFWDNGAAYNISHASADFSILLYPNGAETEFWVEWGDSPLLGESTVHQTVEPNIVVYGMHDEVTGLSPGQEYYFRFRAQNSFGSAATEVDSFSTINMHVDSGRGSVFNLYVRNNSPYTRRLWLGIYDGATYCIDDTLGEETVPPFPPSEVFEVRFVDPRGFSVLCFDQGLYRDFRPITDHDQADTFMVKVQPGSFGLPVIFEWPDLGGLFDGEAVLTDVFGGVLVSIDMKTETSFILSNPALTMFYIITRAPNTSPPPMAVADSVEFPGGSSAILRGAVSPNGQNSAAWFEYGPTGSYGYTTEVETVYATTLFGNVLGVATGLTPGTTYHYRIAATNINGSYYGPDKTFSTLLTDVGEAVSSPPGTFSLLQNYPNPFNPSTSITYQMPSSGPVSLAVFDVFGREMTTLVREWKEIGTHTVEWDARGVPSGIYYCRIIGAGMTQTRKMVLMK